MNDDYRKTGHFRQELPADLMRIEDHLASLRPRQDRLDRERLLFLAGRASAAVPQPAWRCGLNLEHRAWPAAFAAMTAIAAMLFGLLVSRPAVVEQPGAHSNVADAFGPALRRPGEPERQGVLLASDAYRVDIEHLLAQRDYPEDDPSMPSPSLPDGHRDRPTLTPRDWRRLIDAPAAVAPGTNESSCLCPHQGAHS